MALANAFHILAAVIWVGGMFFAYVCLRPVLGDREPAERLQLWSEIFARFFPWVSACIAVLFISGFLMIYWFGGFSLAGKYVYVMFGLAVIMTAIFKFVYAGPYRHLKKAVAEENYKVAAFALGTIRKLVATNLVLGILTICVATLLKTGN